VNAPGTSFHPKTFGFVWSGGVNRSGCRAHDATPIPITPENININAERCIMAILLTDLV